MRRRDCLKIMALAPVVLNTLSVRAALKTHWQRRLVLIDLKGGNDGLNTVIPFAEPQYYALRPKLAINRERVIHLTETAGLHPALEKLQPIWAGRELAIIQGLGYDNPNLSHFRSADIWNTGSDSEVILDQGWLARLFEHQSPPDSFTANGIVLDNDVGPLAGQGTRVLVMRDPRRFMRQAQHVNAIETTTTNEALKHLLQTQRRVHDTAQRLQKKWVGNPDGQDHFPKTRIGRQLAMAAQLVKQQVGSAVIKVSHGSFDTHTHQAGKHHRLLQQLAEALAAFRQAMRTSGQWQQVLVMTYSEFGRRAAENGSGGTDHGTAAPHFVLGGQVKGGLYGQAPSLYRLQDQNLTHTLDYRQLYATAAKWWGMDPGTQPFAKYRSLPVIG